MRHGTLHADRDRHQSADVLPAKWRDWFCRFERLTRHCPLCDHSISNDDSSSICSSSDYRVWRTDDKITAVDNTGIRDEHVSAHEALNICMASLL